jgi:hypothetical protein
MVLADLLIAFATPSLSGTPIPVGHGTGDWMTDFEHY